MDKAIRTVMALALVGCAAQTGVPGGESEVKGRNSASAVESFELGTEVSGRVTATQTDRYAIELQARDRVGFVMRRTSGDLNPYLSMYRGRSQVAMTTINVDEENGVVIKDFTATASGTYIVLARAWRRQGAGNYTISAECVGGTCANEPRLDIYQQDRCIMEARKCALSTTASHVIQSNHRFNMKGVFDDCLAAAVVDEDTEEPAECDTACTVRTGAEVCEKTVDSLRGFLSKGAECADAANECSRDCVDVGLDFVEDVTDLSSAVQTVCWLGGITDYNCKSYALETVRCGGEDPAEGDSSECERLCFATYGTWATEDLGELCSEACP